jgi:hypothetical protein
MAAAMVTWQFVVREQPGAGDPPEVHPPPPLWGWFVSSLQTSRLLRLGIRGEMWEISGHPNFDVELLAIDLQDGEAFIRAGGHNRHGLYGFYHQIGGVLKREECPPSEWSEALDVGPIVADLLLELRTGFANSTVTFHPHDVVLVQLPFEWAQFPLFLSLGGTATDMTLSVGLGEEGSGVGLFVARDIIFEPAVGEWMPPAVKTKICSGRTWKEEFPTIMADLSAFAY